MSSKFFMKKRGTGVAEVIASVRLESRIYDAGR
jgi:hypothetical protein